MLPQEFRLHTGSIPHRLLKEMLKHLPDGLKGEFLRAMINTQDAWLLNVNQMHKHRECESKIVHCTGPVAFINPEYKIERLH